MLGIAITITIRLIRTARSHVNSGEDKRFDMFDSLICGCGPRTRATIGHATWQKPAQKYTESTT
jgi:hypothetical protein